MSHFRLLYFRDNVLDHAVELDACDLRQAIAEAGRKPPHLRVEIWSSDGRVCSIESSPEGSG